jgi:RNA polymerase sigma-70 factor (ECF subfamily)
MTPATSSDDALLRRLQSGKRDAFERIYGAHHPGIYNLCARIVGDREEAKDLTQEVFIKAFSQLPADIGELKLRPWLYRVATNACFDHLRKRTRGAGGDGTEIDELPSRVDGFEQSQTVALVEQTLGQLNERYRTALVLKDLHGLPTEELATVLDIPRATADVLVHRARRSFKKAFSTLAGDGATAPASLGIILAPLAVPAILHAMPALSLAHGSAAASAAAATGGAAASGGAAAGGGIIAKLAGMMTAKVAIVGATAAVVCGGAAIGTVEYRSHYAMSSSATAMMNSGGMGGASAGPMSGWRSAGSRARWGHYSRWAKRSWMMGSRSSPWMGRDGTRNRTWSGSSGSGSGMGSGSGSWPSGSGSGSWSGGSSSIGSSWMGGSGSGW